MDLQTLVEKVGKMAVFIRTRSLQWDNTEWLLRRRKFLDSLAEMEEQLQEAGQVVEDYGWTHTGPYDYWRRVGEPDYVPEELSPEIAREFPEFAKARKREIKERQQGNLLEPVGAASSKAGYSPWG